MSGSIALNLASNYIQSYVLRRPLDCIVRKDSRCMDKTISVIAMGILTIFSAGFYILYIQNYFAERRLKAIQQELTSAIEGNQPAKVDQILTKMPGLIKFLNGVDGHTPRLLHHAIHHGFIEMVKVLMNHKADINAISRCGTGLEVAVLFGKAEMVKFLLKEYKEKIDLTESPRVLSNAVNLSENNKETSTLTHSEKFEIIKCLLENGVQPNPSSSLTSPLASVIFIGWSEHLEDTKKTVAMMLERGARFFPDELSMISTQPKFNGVKEFIAKQSSGETTHIGK